ncbi:MAG: xanthine dehydrogenase family protein subunit M [Actinomycetota bacterium]
MLRLHPFEFAEPASVVEAVAVLGAANGEARALAGGTDLMVDMKLGRMRPRLLVNLKRIPGLDRIERSEGKTRIGALVPVDAVAASAAVREGHRALWQGAGVLGSPPVRHLATIGGNLGRGSPASDLAPPLVVHGARVLVEGPEGCREIPVEELHAGPGVTRLAPGEIITAVLLPDPPIRTGTAHGKLGKRGGGWDLALVGVSVRLTLAEGGEVADARIALASVGPTVLRAREAESRLRGRIPTEEALAAAAEIAAREARPISDVRASADYRRVLARVLTLRTLTEALGRAREPGAGA